MTAKMTEMDEAKFLEKFKEVLEIIKKTAERGEITSASIVYCTNDDGIHRATLINGVHESIKILGILSSQVTTLGIAINQEKTDYLQARVGGLN